MQIATIQTCKRTQQCRESRQLKSYQRLFEVFNARDRKEVRLEQSEKISENGSEIKLNVLLKSNKNKADQQTKAPRTKKNKRYASREGRKQDRINIQQKLSSSMLGVDSNISEIPKIEKAMDERTIKCRLQFMK